MLVFKSAVIMKKRIQAIADCVNVFADSVIKYYEFILEDSNIADLHYAKYIKALKQLNEFGDDGLSALARLLDDDRIVVRVTAASYLIHYCTEKAKKVLNAAAGEDRGIAMLAIVTLKRWETGSYLDPSSGKEVKVIKIEV